MDNEGVNYWLTTRDVDQNTLYFSCFSGEDDTERLNKAVGVINAFGTIGTGDGGSKHLKIDVPIVEIPDGDLIDSFTVDGVHVSGNGMDTTAIRSNKGTLFKMGDGSGFVDTYTFKYLGFYSENPETDLQFIRMQHGTRLLLENIVLHNIPTLIEMFCDAGKVVSNITIQNILGSVANLGKPTIWSHGTGVSSGLYVDNTKLFPNGVPNPSESTTDNHTALVGTDFLFVENQFDTIIVDQTTINRYHKGVNFLADIPGRGLGNIYFNNFIADYQHTAVDMKALGGNLTKINFSQGWLNSTDGRTVNLESTTGLLEYIVFDNMDWMMSGTENIVIPSGSKGIRVSNNRIFGSARLFNNSDGIRAEAGATDYTISGNEWVNSQPYFGTTGVRLPNRGIVVQGANDSYSITDNITRSQNQGYQIPQATNGLKGRVLRNNRKADGTKPEYQITGTTNSPQAGIPYVNHSGNKQEVYLRLGNITQVTLNGISLGSTTSKITLYQGDELILDYTSPPVFVIQNS